MLFNLLCTPSLLQLLIFPVIMSPTFGRKTMYRKCTSEWDAPPSPGKIIASPSFVISFKAMHRPTFNRTLNNCIKLFSHLFRIKKTKMSFRFFMLLTLFANFRFISSFTASTSFKLNISGGILIVSFNSAKTNILIE